ncbi:conjugal transfer protein TrbL family protein [Bacillus atrophaeus]|uniref:conjugal transfer protein TrbL family protein n=1 Tax=Bacillus atrophaeus TaxID=1452 RepID=UPI00228152B2|nr:conjugal transfer protein TrbL family protein [Bacillus atrophaeus]MCY8497762.1 hypothetical protein [Bacillus atrophaeus]MEC0800533.1 hypothetical protein [Bacillus atrophaeus]MEC0818629.1 hypothetical protein [Bacillus atrophaeus]MEC0822085.1 hypothetical protein [Bacillus atrophaeus]
MFNFGDKIKDFFIDVINDVLERTFKFIAKVLFNSEGLTGFFKDLYGIFLACGAMLIVCILLFKVIQGLLAAAANGEAPQALIGDLIISTFKASAMIVIMPFILWLIVGKIVYPLGEFMFGRIGNYTADGVAKILKSGDIGEVIGGEFMFIILFAFVCIAVVAFFIKMCIYHADLLLLQLLSVLAAISIVADDNNYAGIWWREVISQVLTIIVQTACMVGLTEILGNELTWYKFMLLIGLCVILVRGPSVLRNMWYATGSGRSMMNQGGKMAARMMMIRKVFA